MNSRLLLCAAAVAACAVVFRLSTKGRAVRIRMAGRIVYVTSNDYHDNANAVLAYRHKPDGTLAPLPGSPFLTHGAGLANPKQVLGPDDTDDPLVISDDGRFLFAVNGGSNTVAVFSINPDGSLVTVSGQSVPFGWSDAVQCGGQRAVRVCGEQGVRSFACDHAGSRIIRRSRWMMRGGCRRCRTGRSKCRRALRLRRCCCRMTGGSFLRRIFWLSCCRTEEPIGTLLSFHVQGDRGLALASGCALCRPGG